MIVQVEYLPHDLYHNERIQIKDIIYRLDMWYTRNNKHYLILRSEENEATCI